MPTRSSGPSGFDNEEANLGGADAVPDSPDTVERGAEPGAGSVRGAGPTARAPAGGGLGVVGWVVVALAAAALLIYGVGFFR